MKIDIISEILFKIEYMESNNIEVPSIKLEDNKEALYEVNEILDLAIYEAENKQQSLEEKIVENFENIKNIEKIQKFKNREFILTGDSTIENIEGILYKEGLYLVIKGTRNEIKIFINNNNQIIRKPRNIKEIERKTIKIYA
jgi:hypothetical protein